MTSPKLNLLFQNLTQRKSVIDLNRADYPHQKVIFAANTRQYE